MKNLIGKSKTKTFKQAEEIEDDCRSSSESSVGDKMLPRQHEQ